MMFPSKPTLRSASVAIALLLATLCVTTVHAQPKQSPAAPVKYIATVSATIVPIRCPADALLEQVSVREGEMVKRGQVLFRLDPRRQQVAMDIARAHMESAKADYARVRRLLESKAVGQEEVARAAAAIEAAKAEITAAEIELAERMINAPCDGVLTEMELCPGQFLTRGTALVSIVVPEPLKVEWRVPQSQVRACQVGQKFEVIAEGADVRTAGTITFISPVVDTSTGTCLVKGMLPARDGALKPGMIVSVIVGKPE